MTRYRVPFSGVAIAALAAAAPFQVSAQSAGTVRLMFGGASVTTCPYQSITSYGSPAGAVDVTCSTAPSGGGTPTVTPAPTPTPAPTITPGVGTIQWAQTSFAPVAKSTTQPTTPVSGTVSRTNGNTGDNTFNVQVRAGLCLPAFQTVTLHQGDTSGTVNWTTSDVTKCTVELQGLYVGGLATSYVEVAAAASIPVTPAPTPSPTTTPTTSPMAGTPCTNSAGVSAPFPPNGVMESLGPRGSNNFVNDTIPGQIHIFPMPVGVTYGNFSFTSNTVQTPSTLQVEISMSKCPGDVAYYQLPSAMYNGTLAICGSTGIGQSAQAGWAYPGSWYQCNIPPTEQWYMNWRVINNSCNRAEPCGQTFGWT